MSADLVVAMALGVGFGWFLERGGMGSARKLAGQFLLTDLAVFRLLFSAVVTAMLGLFWLQRLGVVEPGGVWVPETWLVPQLVGGLVFGAGFAMGGLCPGTSCVAAVTGRLDGVALMAGMLTGVLVSLLAWPWMADFHGSTPRGVTTLPGAFGVSPGVAAFAVTLVALGGFLGADWIEARRGAPRSRVP